MEVEQLKPGMLVRFIGLIQFPWELKKVSPFRSLPPPLLFIPNLEKRLILFKRKLSPRMKSSERRSDRLLLFSFKS
jgi:hypothetical protein